MPINYTFDARQFEPRQELPKHPVGKFQLQIINTEIEATSKGDGQMLSITFRSQYGQIVRRYVIVHPNQQTVKIAFEQLSALCYAIGIPTIDFNQDGANIRGATLWGEIREQPNNKDFVELWKVFDMNGNEPGKPATVAAAPSPQPGHVPPQSAAYPPAAAPAAFAPSGSVPGSSQMAGNFAPQTGGGFPATGAPTAPSFPASGPASAPGGAFQPQTPPSFPGSTPEPAAAPSVGPANWPGNAPGAVPPFAGGR